MKKKIIRFYPSLLIFLGVCLWVFIVVGVLEYFQWLLVPGMLIHSGIIIIAFAGTAFLITKSASFLILLDTLSLKKAAWRYHLIAIIFAVVIWVADFWLQLFFFLDDGKNDDLALQTEIMHWGRFNIVFASCFLAPVAEEILFRGILLQGLLERLNVFVAIMISSLLFAIIHFSVQDFISLFIVSVGYALLTISAQSILPAILAHFINNVVTVYYLSTL